MGGSRSLHSSLSCIISHALSPLSPSQVLYSLSTMQSLIAPSCYGFGPIARYGTCPTLVVWATDEGFIDQLGSLS